MMLDSPNTSAPMLMRGNALVLNVVLEPVRQGKAPEHVHLGQHSSIDKYNNDVAKRFMK
jgi:hypothetical protein